MRLPGLAPGTANLCSSCFRVSPLCTKFSRLGVVYISNHQQLQAALRANSCLPFQIQTTGSFKVPTNQLQAGIEAQGAATLRFDSFKTMTTSSTPCNRILDENLGAVDNKGYKICSLLGLNFIAASGVYSGAAGKPRWGRKELLSFCAQILSTKDLGFRPHSVYGSRLPVVFLLALLGNGNAFSERPTH